MRVISVSSRAADPVRAGVDLGRALAPIEPEVVFLFSAIHYAESDDLIQAIVDTIGQPDLIVIGNTGDGYFDASGAYDNGVVAMGLSSEGQVQWLLEQESGVQADPAGTTRRLLDRVQSASAPHKPAWCFFVSDFKTDAAEIESALSGADFPVIGGLAADDNRMHDCVLYCRDGIRRDAAFMLAALGPMRFEIAIGNSLTPVGQCGVVEAAEGSNVFRIGGQSAMDFIEQETGKPVLQSDRGITSLTIIDSDEPEIKRLRSIVPDFSRAERSLGLYGGIEAGRTVQVCLARASDLIAEVHTIAERIGSTTSQPIAALIVSCAARKSVLGHEVQREAQALSERLGEGVAIAGFPSFGEIGPLKIDGRYTRNLFHNMTYVVLLLSA
ncbi:MAG: FIST C-terminal domain-containing protein [Burkholderiales bacterium]|nr:FIST C-terminal domain-containing protein [Burkholderiales bacterium]